MDVKGQSTYKLQSSNLLGNKVTVVIQPGKPKVDYLRIEQFHGSRNLSYSFEENNIQNSDPKTSIYADQARFVIYKHLVENSIRAHVTIFHLNSVPRSNALGPWLVRAAVEDALSSEVLEVDTNAQMRSILEATLKPNLSLWAGDTPLIKRIGPKTEQLILT
jgi:hypothetical protein